MSSYICARFIAWPRGINMDDIQDNARTHNGHHKHLIVHSKCYLQKWTLTYFILWTLCTRVRICYLCRCQNFSLTDNGAGTRKYCEYPDLFQVSQTLTLSVRNLPYFRCFFFRDRSEFWRELRLDSGSRSRVVACPVSPPPS